MAEPNLSHLIEQAQIATGRSRKLAEYVILPRLRQIAREASRNEDTAGITYVEMGRLDLWFIRGADQDRLFEIHPADGSGEDPLMTGGFRGRELEIHSWRRGWEAELFLAAARFTAQPGSLGD